MYTYVRRFLKCTFGKLDIQRCNSFSYLYIQEVISNTCFLVLRIITQRVRWEVGKLGAGYVKDGVGNRRIGNRS